MIDKYRKWFESDVAAQIPKLVEYFLKISGTDMSEYYSFFKDSELVDSGSTNEELNYTLMDEPYIQVHMNFKRNFYKIIIADQMSIRSKFETTELDTFIRHWNTVVVNYYGDDNIRLPYMPN